MQGQLSQLFWLIGGPMRLKGQGHLYCQEWKVFETPAYGSCWEWQTAERKRSGNPKSVLCFYARIPTRIFSHFQFQRLPVMERPPHLYSLTYAFDLGNQISIWYLHLNITQEPQTQRVRKWSHHSSEITSAFAFSLQMNDSTIQCHPGKKSYSFTHWSERNTYFITCSLPGNVCLL